MRLSVLRQRVYTALALVTTFLLVLFSGSWLLFYLLTGTVVCLAAWEWAALSGLGSTLLRSLFTAFVGTSGALLWYVVCEYSPDLFQTLLVITTVWWGIALLWVQGYPSSAVMWGRPLIRLLMGWWVLVPAWLALSYLRTLPAGEWLVMMVVFIVAAADTGAYFSGRRFGRVKLAKNVSPGKTWEGVIGGMLFALIVGFIANYLIFERSWLLIATVVLPTAFVSVLGDLLESMVKRHQGLKDSGCLLPGHGGFMDRIDGLVAAAPTFTLALLSVHWNAGS